MLDRLTAILAQIGAGARFASRRVVPEVDLRLAVTGVGAVEFPLTRASAEHLITVAKRAPYGKGTKTLVDRRVRDTWVIAPEQIEIDPRWRRTLDPMVTELARDLGLSSELRAELHDLLIYEPGQFFLPHQDAEKTDGMIGTLVVDLPSDYSGGEMVIEHHGESLTFGRAASGCAFLAFFADCRHEIRPVQRGHRVVLTYNLVLAGDRERPRAPGALVDALATEVRHHFEAEAPRKYGRPAAKPERMGFLLDHEYTDKGLSWKRLKSPDAQRAAALIEVAARLDCEIYLALADVHESWGCEDEDYRGRRWGRAPRETHGAPVLTELYDTEIELRAWMAPGDRRAAPVTDSIDRDEVCFTRPNIDVEPFRTEHEGYTGNAGNTVDRWYHRAAIVLWPREHGFVLRARASRSWAMGEIAKLLESGARDEAMRRVEQILPDWTRVEDDSPLLLGTLEVACALGSEPVARALLRPFRLKDLSPERMPAFIAVVNRYGLEWSRALIQEWLASERYGRAERWAQALPELAGPLAIASDAGMALARELVSVRWTAEQELVRARPSPRFAAETQRDTAARLVALLEGTAITDDRQTRAEILGALATADEALLLEVLRTSVGLYPPEGLVQLGLDSLHAKAIAAVSARLALPPRAPDDWSVRLDHDCQCHLCGTLRRFLSSRVETRLDWPLAKAGRQHIHGVIDGRALPVTHETLRRGSPLTLVLVKQRSLFDRDLAAREALAADLAWLRSVEGTFAVDEGAPKRRARRARR